jgi:hypothetical protein
MITCKFNGRLGNNLFQMANVISMSEKTGEEFIFPETSDAGHRGKIKVDLSMFGYNFNLGEYITKNNYYEKRFEFDYIPKQNDVTFHGFYQSWKYFDDIRDLILNKYFIPTEKIQNNLKKYDVEDSLGICVRRGDYLWLQQNHCVLDIEYYNDCTKNHLNHLQLNNIFIFSDDLEWCKDNFSEVTFVEDDIGTQLFLMSKMTHLVLSNSTFSWWGAYLNNNNGVIIAPTPWFGNNYMNKYSTTDLYYPRWILQNHKIKIQKIPTNTSALWS